MMRCLFLLPLLLGTALAQTTRPAGSDLPALNNTAVSIPWNDLRGLLDKARGDKPPVDYVLSAASYAVTVGDKAAVVTCDLEVTLLSDRWALVPLGASTGITRVLLNDKSAATVVQNATLMVLIEGKGDGKSRLQVALERPIEMEAGRARIELPLPPSPLVSISAAIPQANLDVTLPGASAMKTAENANQTTLTASAQGGRPLMLSYAPRPAQAAGAARTYADTETQVSVEPGLLRVTASVTARIERSALAQLRLNVDPKAVVLSVSGKDIARWSEENADGGKALLVQFASAAEGERVIEVVYERDIPDAGGEAVLEPVALDGARRNRGLLAVRSSGAFDVRPGKSSAERISVSELPEPLRTSATQIAYRYAELPAAIALTLERVKKLPPRIIADTLTRVAVDRGILQYHAQVQYEILHAGIDTLRISLPEGVDLLSARGNSVRDTQTVVEGRQRTLVVGLKDVAKGSYVLDVAYEKRFAEADAAPQVQLLTHPDAAVDQGRVGIEVRGSYELTPAIEGAERVDVKELPESLWGLARSPILFGYRYDSPAKVKLALGITRHEDLDVLVAMADICEATTTITPDGKVVTKTMYILRNNLKQFMVLRLPEGAQIWSAFVDDRPVTPSKNAKGEILIPLKKSDKVEDDDEQSYRQKREQRRTAQDQDRVKVMRDRLVKADDAPADLKPYDVEIVFVTPQIKLEEKGTLKLELPRSDIPTGQLAWAVFLPRGLRVVDASGNLAEVNGFSLPFKHFGEAEYERQLKSLREAAKDMAKLQQAQQMERLRDFENMVVKAKGKGVLPVRVDIPITGEIHRYEKFLTVDEAPAQTLTYHRKPS